MAKMPTPSAEPIEPPMSDDAAGADAGAAPGDEGAEESDVLLTVVKEADGTYSLIKGDEQEADGEDAAGAAATPGTPEEANKQSFDSVGALLKAILDLLNEDKSSEGAEGSSGDQFQAGFDENAPPKPAAPIPQKF